MAQCNTFTEFLTAYNLDITIRADEGRYYVWSDTYPEIPPCKARKPGKALDSWLDDFETGLHSGEVTV